MELTKIQREMLKQMLDWDMEYSYPYSEFNDIADKNTLKKEMRGLISNGFVKISRGGISDDDGRVVGGTGFFIDYERIKDIKQEIQTSSPSLTTSQEWDRKMKKRIESIVLYCKDTDECVDELKTEFDDTLSILLKQLNKEIRASVIKEVVEGLKKYRQKCYDHPYIYFDEEDVDVADEVQSKTLSTIDIIIKFIDDFKYHLEEK